MAKKLHITLVTLTAALALVLVAGSSSEAQRGGEGGPICGWERSQAMAAGRAGNTELADLLWQVYWDCLHDR